MIQIIYDNTLIPVKMNFNSMHKQFVAYNLLKLKFSKVDKWSNGKLSPLPR